MLQWNPYLTFNGNCEAAFKMYAEIFGAKIDAMMTHKGTPMEPQTPAAWADKILHARMTLDGQTLMGSDAPPERYQKTQGISVSIQLKGIAEAERIFAALAQGGLIQMPIQQTFWAVRFGMLTDQFGIPWMINCES